ncbi:hypothetical protein PG988_001298 [Apiospora saccharicola]
MASFGQNRKPRPVILGGPPSKEERRQRKTQEAYPSPPASQRRHGGPGVKEIEFAKTMEGHPNEIRTQYVSTNRPETVQVGHLVETEEMRLQAIEKRKERDREIREQNKAANLKYVMDTIVNAMPSDADKIVGPNLFWRGGDDMQAYYKWLHDEYYDGDMPEIVRRANAFRGFPQLDDPDYYPDIAAERRAYYRSEEGREELRPYLPAIKKYTSKAEYVVIEGQVNGLTAVQALDAALIAQDKLMVEKLTPSALAESAAESDAESDAEDQVEDTLEEFTSSAIAELEAAYFLDQEPQTPAAPATLAADDTSYQLERSATLGRTPLEFEMSPGLSVTPNPDGPPMEYLDPQMIKAEPMSSTISNEFRTHWDSVKKCVNDAAAEAQNEQNVKDDDVKDEEISAVIPSIPFVSTPAATPTKEGRKPRSTGLKRKGLYDNEWKPSSAGGMSSSTDDDEPSTKRVKQSHRGAARR